MAYPISYTPNNSHDTKKSIGPVTSCKSCNTQNGNENNHNVKARKVCRAYFNGTDVWWIRSALPIHLDNASTCFNSCNRSRLVKYIGVSSTVPISAANRSQTHNGRFWARAHFSNASLSLNSLHGNVRLSTKYNGRILRRDIPMTSSACAKLAASGSLSFIPVS